MDWFALNCLETKICIGRAQNPPLPGKGGGEGDRPFPLPEESWVEAGEVAFFLGCIHQMQRRRPFAARVDVDEDGG